MLPKGREGVRGTRAAAEQKEAGAAAAPLPTATQRPHFSAGASQACFYPHGSTSQDRADILVPLPAAPGRPVLHGAAGRACGGQHMPVATYSR